jgi:hypothetical protein
MNSLDNYFDLVKFTIFIREVEPYKSLWRFDTPHACPHRDQHKRVN